MASKLWLTPRMEATRAIAAPEYPPISACDELLGRPKYQVTKSQTMAPIRPAMMT